MFEFRFYSSQDESLNYHQPPLDLDAGYLVLYNLPSENSRPECPNNKPRDFTHQYSYYLSEDEKIFSIYLSNNINVNISGYGTIGGFLKKLLVLHYPKEYDPVRIYVPNCVTPITKLTKGQFRFDCVQDLLLALKDDYSIELI